MSEMKLELTTKQVIPALAILAILVVVKLATLGQTDDPELHAAIQAELMNELGGRIGQDLEALDQNDGAAVAAFIERANSEGIQLHSASVSKPLMSFGSSVEAVVRIEYTLPGGPRRTAYWRFEHSTIAGWRYRRSTMALFYYLNFF